MLFTCPYCGASTDVAPQFIGQTGPCASCGKTVTIAQPYPPKSSSTIWWIIIPVVIVLMVLGGLGFLLYMGIGGARDAAHQSHCTNNLKQIGLAMHNHHDTLRTLPPAYITDENGKRLHSWRVLLLPYFEERGLFEQIRLDEPWDSPHNRQFHSQMPDVYRCPSADSDRSSGFTNYMVVVDDDAKNGARGRTPFGPGRLRGNNWYEGGLSFASIIDGTSNTVFVVEVAGSTTNWMEPSDLKLSQQTKVNASKSGDCLSSEHNRGVNVVMGDGSIQVLDESVSRETLKDLLRRDDSVRRD